MRISDWSSDVCSSDLHTIISPVRRIVAVEAMPTLPRYSLGAFAELPELLQLMHRDFWDSTGVPFTPDLTINPNQCLAYAGVEAAQRRSDGAARSEERREEKESVSTCRSRGDPVI